MKTFLATLGAATALAATAGQAQAAGSAELRIRQLERQVAALTAARPTVTPADRKIAALTKRVTALEKKVVTLTKATNEATTVGGIAIIYTACASAVAADALAGTWALIDQVSAATQAGKTYFPALAAIDDVSSCSQLRITRPQPLTVPPTLANFSALTALIRG